MIKSALQSSLTNDVKYRSMSAGAVPSNEYLIASTILSEASPSVTFDNLGQFAGVYKHLKLVGVARTARTASQGDNLSVQFNGDTGSNYRWHLLLGTGSSVLSLASAQGTETLPFWVNSNTSPTGAFGVGEVDILDAFSSNKNTVIRSLTGTAGAEVNIRLTSGLWINTASLTSLRVYSVNGSNLLQGSRFSLYGVN
jgi:hypothetical protein